MLPTLLSPTSQSIDACCVWATAAKVSMRGSSVVSPGKPALLASAEDPTTHRRFEVTVTATKLR